MSTICPFSTTSRLALEATQPPVCGYLTFLRGLGGWSVKLVSNFNILPIRKMSRAVVCFSCISTCLAQGHLYLCEIIQVCTVLGGKRAGKRMHVTLRYRLEDNIEIGNGNGVGAGSEMKTL
jgi:hypothetical protein